MVRTKRLMGFLLAVLLLFMTPAATLAAPDTKDSLEQQITSDTGALSNAKNEKKNLESSLEAAQESKETLVQEKNQLASHMEELDGKMSTVSAKLWEVESLLETKTKQLSEMEERLEKAQEDIKVQYEDMKIRIQFMYEHGTMSFIEILFSCKSFSDLLNKAEYIEQVSAYDREMLDEFEATKKKIEKLEKDLEVEQEALQMTKGEVEKQQQEMKGLIEEKRDEIEEYEADIENKQKAIEEYENMIKEQDDMIRALESSVAEAKRKRAQMNVSGNGTPAPTYRGGAFCWPAPSYTRISDEYGERMHPILQVTQYHNGLDMAAPSGSPILAAADGYVVAAAYNATMGNYIMLDHGDGLYTIYMHASALYVSEGQNVEMGEQIAAVGSTGRSTGPHLHFGVRLNGSYVNPWNYL